MGHKEVCSFLEAGWLTEPDGSFLLADDVEAFGDGTNLRLFTLDTARVETCIYFLRAMVMLSGASSAICSKHGRLLLGRGDEGRTRRHIL